MTRALHVRHLPFGRAALLDLDRPLVIHAHSRQHLLLHMGGAEGTFGVNHHVFPLMPEHAVFVDSWQPHWYPHARPGQQSRVLALYLDPPWFAAQDTARKFAPEHNSLRVGRLAAHWAALFVAELQEHEDGRDGVLEYALLELLASLEPAAAATPTAGPWGKPPLLDRRIDKTLLYLREHVGERPDFASVASAAGLSRPHFFELFQRQLGLTPNVYWNVLRMESAIAQLTDPRVSVAAISANLGFSAQSNFTRFFRDIQGVAPAEYRAARIPTPS